MIGIIGMLLQWLVLWNCVMVPIDFNSQQLNVDVAITHSRVLFCLKII